MVAWNVFSNCLSVSSILDIDTFPFNNVAVKPETYYIGFDFLISY